jgi:hypothetical protein
MYATNNQTRFPIFLDSESHFMKEISMGQIQSHRNTAKICLALLAGLSLFGQPVASYIFTSIQE